MTYQSFTPIEGTTKLSAAALGVPPGTAVEPQVAELLRDIAIQLGLPQVGVVTPWAKRVGDISWQEIQNPDTNVALFELTDEKVSEASKALFGQQLPFVTVVSEVLPSVSEIRTIVGDSNYELFETQGVYRQDDPDVVPKVYYLHWLRVRDLPDQPTRGVKSLEQVARELQGFLSFSQQVPKEGTTVRAVPVVSFEDALRLQEEAPGIPDTPEDVTGPVQPHPEPRSSVVGPVLVGAGVLAATLFLGKRLRK